ncbi:hypothetical protein BJ322DRAFT_1114093 [Thelephora terrestris]|uniref:U4/U6 snRNA-associated-splicing factor PRP24 n=1 Tax=Thelephora terrestris TaxID=56493 RepID=A0A9P6L172_9AGAM|nr:hypothetical protein BJ322DRAFT_1114093 [Thelephora terrestris]
MDEAESLEALSNILTSISENPYDFSLHVQHINVAETLGEGQQDQALSAREMMTGFWAAGEEVWLPLINAKKASVDLDTEEGVAEVLELYEKAEDDYLSIDILKAHLELLIDRYNAFRERRSPPVAEDPFSIQWTREAMEDVVEKAIGHSHVLWDLHRDWELELLESLTPDERLPHVAYIEQMFLARLRQPHSNNDATFQAYSSFTTNYKPATEYEGLLVTASKARTGAVKSYAWKESREAVLTQQNFSLEAYAYYISEERKGKRLDMFALPALYERAIAEAAKRRFAGDLNAEVALRAFWVGYIDTLRVGESEKTAFTRASRSVPGSGEVWARFIRFLESKEEEDDPMDGGETVSNVYARALSTGLIQKDIEQIVVIVLAGAGAERRKAEASPEDQEAWVSLIKVLEEGIAMTRAAQKAGDPRLRLERYLSEVYAKIGLGDSAVDTWKAVVKLQKSSYLAWIGYTDLLTKLEKYDEVRAVFSDICQRKIDWPETIWDSWIFFENLYGDVESLEECLSKVEKAQAFVDARRAKEAEQAAYSNTQATAGQAIPNVPAKEVQPTTAAEPSAMEVDGDAATQESVGEGHGGVKRKAGEDAEPAAKKLRMELSPAPLKRDREHCTVFVSNLPESASEDDLKSLFKDCGEIREVKITKLANFQVATVEFAERENVPAALTKDKKRIHGDEISVHLAWKSTLYVTNFPPSMDDSGMRALFGKYGTLFDVRWPSKKFKSTRRFCYVQFTSPDAAEAALTLHGTQMAGDLILNVFISNPERKKERTDADANDREVYVAGLSKFVSKGDLEKLFKTYGPLKDVRMTTDHNGHSKGFAFVEFVNEQDARMALSANNHELKRRRIAVTLADTRVKGKSQNVQSETGLGRLEDALSRSVRIKNLPPGTQEGLLQQVLEQHATVKRVEVFDGINQATVELENTSEAGKLLLRSEPIVFNGVELSVSEEKAIKKKPGGTGKPTKGAPDVFVPRTTASKPRAGIGSKKAAGTRPPVTTTVTSAGDASSSRKAQDDFRKMLG